MEFTTDLVYPHQSLPMSAKHMAEIAISFHNDGDGIFPDQAVKALAARDLLLETYGEAFPFKELLEPTRLALKIKNNEIFPFFFVFDGKPVGTASIMPDGHGGAEFGRTVVQKKFFGHSIGDQLLLARFSFASLYRRELGIEWIYCTTRSINQRIQVIWLNSPERLVPVSIGFYYVFFKRETYTGFVRHFTPVQAVQNIGCIPDLHPIVKAVCGQFKNCQPNFGQFDESPKLPAPSASGHYSKYYVGSLADVANIDMGSDYIEAWVATNTAESVLIQEKLLKSGFMPTGFYPGFSSHPPFLTFGNLRAGLPIRGANFPKEFGLHPVGIRLEEMYNRFCQGRQVELRDPFGK